MAGLPGWSRRLAAAAVPDEVELAPLIITAYVAGGEARDDLYHRAANGQLGGFGPGATVMVFPWIVRGLTIAAPLLTVLLAAAPHVNELLDIVKSGFDLQAAAAKRDAEAADVEDAYLATHLRRTLAILDQELSAVPLAQGERERICYQVLRALLEAPDESQEVVVTLKVARDKA